jgi:hypothetical protein
MRVAHSLCSVALLLVCLATAERVTAQGTGLEGVEELARMGRTDAARALLVDWWDSDRAEASRDDLQRALWLRGRLTVDPIQARLDYQRLVVLYPAGPFTDQALLRLAQAAHALGDEEGAERHVAALVRDYPNSPARRDAEEWLAGAGPPPPVEVESDSPAGGTDPMDVVPEAESNLAEPGEFSVQLGAFGELEGAEAVFDQAVASGFDARIVRVEGSPLYHVRVGSVRDRERAQDLLQTLERADISAAVVRDSRREELVSGRR